MTDTRTSNNRNMLLIIVAVVAVLLFCCCIIVAAAGAIFIAGSDSGGTEIIITPAPATQPPSSENGQITINTFSINPERIVAGECATLAWSITGADTVQLIRDSAVIMDNTGLDDSYQDCLDEPGIYRYRLEAKNSGGFYQWMELQLIVDAGSSQ